MNLLSKLKGFNAKDVLGVVLAFGAGAVAIVNALSDQKKAKEFEEMKKIVFSSKE